MRFDFGRNWEQFSLRALTGERVAQARADFARLFDGLELAGKTFLDIGFGQGLSLLSATALGARGVGCDVDPVCAQVLHRNACRFPDVTVDDIPVIIGSILDAKTQAEIRGQANGGFDIVHAWGVLHHTGDLRRAIQIAADLVAPRGHLVVAIYNRHWSSPLWRQIKWLYGRLPSLGKRCLVTLLYPVIWTAKLAVTARSPKRQERGMAFYYDVVDWVGGYPYEYATVTEVRAMAKGSGLEYLRHHSPRVPTGCNELVFWKPERP